MTNGRIIPLTGQEPSLSVLFSDLMTLNGLTTDQEQYDCHTAPLNLNGYVEKDAESAVFQFVGTGLKTIAITDANGNSIPTANYITFKNPNFISVNIGSADFNKYVRGVWKISALATTGGCQVTVRQKTPVGLILGFTSSSTDDVAISTQIITQRSKRILRIHYL
uniref:Uncharacterized protein n=1 Tax=Caenorhabditis japonica TaxID=281687 RepID=A0A8R1I971_CAEJA